MTKYLLDTNVLIEAKNRHYGFDFCPAFWDRLIAKNAVGSVFSVARVGEEIAAGRDDLAAWAAQRVDRFFLRPTRSSAKALADVGDWAEAEGYTPAAIRRFTRSADCFLVAHAFGTDLEVVTHQVASASRKRVKIPNACAGLGIRCLTPFEMLRRERARFVLGATP